MSNKVLGVGSRGTIQHFMLYGPLDPTLCALLLIQHALTITYITRQGQVRKTRGTQCTNINGTHAHIAVSCVVTVNRREGSSAL